MAGLDDIRPINYLRQKVISIYANKTSSERLRQEFPYIFEGDYPGVPMIDLKNMPEKPFKIKGVEVTPINIKHGEMDVVAFRIGDFTYLTDGNFIEDTELEKIKGSEVFVINALRRQEHYSHFTLGEALEIIQRTGARQSYLIHMSHLMGLHAEVEEELPSNVNLSFDGLKIEL